MALDLEAEAIDFGSRRADVLMIETAGYLTCRFLRRRDQYRRSIAGAVTRVAARAGLETDESAAAAAAGVRAFDDRLARLSGEKR